MRSCGRAQGVGSQFAYESEIFDIILRRHGAARTRTVVVERYAVNSNERVVEAETLFGCDTDAAEAVAISISSREVSLSTDTRIR